MKQNKDYAGMMAGMPQASPSMAEPAAGGVSPTQTVQAADEVKEQIVAALEERGVFNNTTDQKQMQEIMGLVDQLVQQLEAGDQQAIMQNPIMQLLGINPQEIDAGVKVAKKSAAKATQKQQQMSQTPPPGMGGGMPGLGGM